MLTLIIFMEPIDFYCPILAGISFTFHLLLHSKMKICPGQHFILWNCRPLHLSSYYRP